MVCLILILIPSFRLSNIIKWRLLTQEPGLSKITQINESTDFGAVAALWIPPLVLSVHWKLATT